MLYRRKSFTLPVSSGNGTMCLEKGHSAPDSRGVCLCCGDKIAASAKELEALHRSTTAPLTGESHGT